MSGQSGKTILADVMYGYGTITLCTKHGGMILPCDRGLLKHYADREIVSMWVNCIDRHAYIQIR